MNGLCLIKRIISFILVLFMLTVSAFAEDTRNISYKVNVDEGKNISVVETSLEGDIDNSNLNVKVIKQKGDDETVVYTGPLGDYADGLWNYTDFSEIQFLVIFDWDGPSDEALYIMPLDDGTSQTTTEENVIVQSDETTSSPQSLTNIVPVDVTSYDETYSIKQAIIKNSYDVIVYDCESNGKLESVTLVKHTNDTIPAKMFVALYNGGIMENMQMVDVVGTGGENSEIICNVNMTLGTITDNHYIKIMVWDGFNSMRPLVDAYNTSIITTDYVYNNTIQSAGQIDSYSFSVNKDGYYSITVPTGSNINGELYHSSSSQTPIATENNMSASNKITQYLLKDEVYTVKFTSQTVGTYGFSIIEDTVENSLVLNTSKSGSISYPKDRLVYEFTPTETAMYFFESTSDVHPYIILFDSSDNMLEVADNLEYENTVVLGYELEANQTYYLRIGSQSRLVGNISTYVKKVKVSISGTTVNISGNLDTVSGNRVALGIYDSVGSLKRISQVNTSSNGSFTYSTVLDTSNQSYQCIINQNSKTVPVRFEFGNGVISKIIDDYELATVTGSATVTPTFSASRISANANMSVDISIKNNDNNTQDILLYWVLCDTNGIIVKACGTGSEFVSGQTEVLHMEMNMPASVSGLTLKLFTWQGKNIDHSTFRPLAKVYSISTSGTSSLSIEDNGLSIGEIEATSEVELITDENVDATLDYTEIKATSGLLNTATPLAINELDLIDMNFQVRCNDKNTGGELQLGKNIITIYYKPNF